MTYRCDPAIGSLPMGTPDLAKIEELIRTLRKHRQTIGGQNTKDIEDTRRSTAISAAATHILQALIFHEPTANQHIITHRFDGAPKHRFGLAGPIFSRNVDDSITAGVALRTIIGYAKKIRQLGPAATWRQRSKSETANGFLIHPAELVFTAARRARDQDSSVAWPNLNIQPGTPRYDWLKPVATVFNIEAQVPLTILDSLPGRQLCEVIELPATLNAREEEAWQSLTIATASVHDVPGAKRLNLTLEPAWEFIRDPRPGKEKPEQDKAWLELASVAEQI